MSLVSSNRTNEKHALLIFSNIELEDSELVGQHSSGLDLGIDVVEIDLDIEIFLGIVRKVGEHYSIVGTIKVERGRELTLDDLVLFYHSTPDRIHESHIHLLWRAAGFELYEKRGCAANGGFTL